MTHIAIQEQLDGKTADWMEKMSLLSAEQSYQIVMPTLRHCSKL